MAKPGAAPLYLIVEFVTHINILVKLGAQLVRNLTGIIRELKLSLVMQK